MLMNDAVFKCRVGTKARGKRATADTAFRELCGAILLRAVLAKHLMLPDHLTAGDATANEEIMRRTVEKRAKTASFAVAHGNTPLSFSFIRGYRYRKP